LASSAKLVPLVTAPERIGTAPSTYSGLFEIPLLFEISLKSVLATAAACAGASALAIAACMLAAFAADKEPGYVDPVFKGTI
jgi:hypothetical protein